jgi:hypothetical protein
MNQSRARHREEFGPETFSSGPRSICSLLWEETLERSLARLLAESQVRSHGSRPFLLRLRRGLSGRIRAHTPVLPFAPSAGTVPSPARCVAGGGWGWTPDLLEAWRPTMLDCWRTPRRRPQATRLFLVPKSQPIYPWMYIEAYILLISV